MTFDWSVNLGHVMTFVALIGTAMAFVWNQGEMMRGHFDKIHASVTELGVSQRKDSESTAQRLDKMEARMDEIAVATIAIARQDERMKHFEHRLESLEEDVALLSRPNV